MLAAAAVQEIMTDFRRFPLRVHSAEALYDVAWPVAQDSGQTSTIASTWPRP